jgi:hypothetical protein
LFRRFALNLATISLAPNASAASRAAMRLSSSQNNSFISSLLLFYNSDLFEAAYSNKRNFQINASARNSKNAIFKFIEAVVAGKGEKLI